MIKSYKDKAQNLKLENILQGYSKDIGNLLVRTYQLAETMEYHEIKRDFQTILTKSLATLFEYNESDPVKYSITVKSILAQIKPLQQVLDKVELRKDQHLKVQNGKKQ